MANQRYSVTIKDLPIDERPRERLVKYGPDVLSNAELLAIILRVGTMEYSAIGLAEHILASFNGLKGIATSSVEELSTIKGLGTAKAAQILAMVELGKRLAASVGEERPAIHCPRDAADLLIPELRDAPQERFKAVLLNTKGEVLKIRDVTIGTLNSTVVIPRDVFRIAVASNSASVIVAHNHPSGDPTPSRDDINITRRLVEAGEIVGIEVLDHLIVGDGRWISLKERGLM
ncbi:MAG: RadC family protein [Armatimonadota bacterium]